MILDIYLLGVLVAFSIEFGTTIALWNFDRYSITLSLMFSLLSWLWVTAFILWLIDYFFSDDQDPYSRIPWRKRR